MEPDGIEMEDDKAAAITSTSGEPPEHRGLQPLASPRPTGEVPRSPETRAEEIVYAGLEQIREILYGAAHRELERRLARADAHLVARTRELEQENRRRMDVLEAHVKKETEALLGRIERESAETADALRKMARDHSEAVAGVEHKLAKIEESSAQGGREMRQQLLDQAKSFLDELRRLRRELLAAMQRELGLTEGELTEEFREAEEHARRY